MEKKLAEIVARMKKVNEDQQSIERDAGLNNDGVFTDEQRSQYEALDSMYADLEKQKESIEKQMTLMASRADRQNSLAPFSLRRSNPNSGAPVTQPSGQPIQVATEASEGTRVEFKIHRTAFRGGTLSNFKGTKDGLDAEHRAYRFGQWVLARISQDLPGQFSFPSAIQFVQNYMQPFNTAHGETGTTGGHFLVPEEFSADLIDLREQFGVARRLFGNEPMTTDIKHVPRRASGLTAYFVNENDTGTESNMTWDDIQLSVKDLMVIARMSNQLSADASISVGDKLAGEIAYAFANKEDQCAFNGDGTSTYGGIRGVRTLLTSIDDAGADSAGLKIQGTSNTWSAQVLADFHAVVGKLPIYADTDAATWICHKTYYSEVMQKLELAAGGVTSYEIAAGDRRPRPMFLGYPVTFSQVFPSATATTGVTTVLGNFSLGALFGDRQGTSIAFSDAATVGGQSTFERNQIAVRGTERFDINIHGCGTTAVVGPIVGLATA